MRVLVAAYAKAAAAARERRLAYRYRLDGTIGSRDDSRYL